MILCWPKMFSSKPCETGRTLLVLRHSWLHPLRATSAPRTHAPPLRLRAGVETEDGVVVAGGDVGSDRARRREMVRDVVVRPAHVEADVGAGPIVIRHWKRRWRLEW